MYPLLFLGLSDTISTIIVVVILVALGILAILKYVARG